MSIGRLDAIVIGGSAGALEALGRLLPALPADMSVAVAIVVHLPPTRPSHLAEVLGGKTRLPVKEVEDKEPVVPGTVYVAPPGYHLLIEKGRTFALSTDDLVHFSRPAIDVLFESAAEVYGDRLAGIILTGANADGARGLLAIKRRGQGKTNIYELNLTARSSTKNPDRKKTSGLERKKLSGLERTQASGHSI